MIALDRYNTGRLAALEKEVYHIQRRMRQFSLAAMIVLVYDEYHHMELSRICANGNMSYQEAEDCAEKYSEVFDMEVPVSAFLPDEKHYDRAIEHFEKYKEFREVFTQFGYEVADVDAFCKQVENGAHTIGLQCLYAYNSVGYVYAMRGVYDYICRSVNFNQMMQTLQLYFPPKLKPMTKAQRYIFTKTMFRAVREFEDIANKRMIRKHKKRK